MAAALLVFGFVFAQSQGASAMLLRSSLAKTPKFLAAGLPGDHTREVPTAGFRSLPDFCLAKGAKMAEGK
jgi:hypothetical protein